MRQISDSIEPFIDKKRNPLVILCVLLFAGLIIYSNALPADFHFDDFSFIVNNYPVRHIENPELIWSSFRTRFIAGLSFALNYYFSKLDPFSYHLVNIIIHAVNAFLVFILAGTIFGFLAGPNRITAQKINRISLFAALIFLAHPIQTEAVTYISQRFSVLGAFFYLSAVVCYVRARRDQNKALYILSLTAAVLAMLTKEFAFTIPIVLILCEIYFIRGTPVKDRVVRLIPFLTSMSIIPLVLFFSGAHNADMKLNEQLSTAKFAWHNLWTQINVLRTYLRLLILPVNQNLDYDYPVAQRFFEAPTALSFCLLCALFALGLYLFKRQRALSFCIMWFFATISVEFAAFAIIGFDRIFEHCLYLPMAGFAMAASIILISLPEKSKTAIILSSLLIIVLSGAAYKRNAVWRNRLTLWEDVIKKSPNKARPYNNLAIYYDDIKEHGKAVALYQKAIELDPGSSEYYINLGSSYGQMGQLDKAAEYTLKGVELKDDLNHLIKAFTNLGDIYDKTGDLDKSVYFYESAVRRDPYNAKAYVNLSAVYLKQGNHAKAVEYALAGIAVDPGIAEGYNNLGMAYGGDGNTQKAVEYFKKGIALDPGKIPIRINLGRAYIKQNMLEEAVNTFEQCLRVDPDHAQAHFLLGFSYWKTRDIDKAVQKIGDLRDINEHKFADNLEMLINEQSLFSL